VVIAGKTESAGKLPVNTHSGFFCDVDSLHRVCDVVVSTGAGKSATDALRNGLAMLCVPIQGEQMENALVLESLGAALMTDSTRLSSREISARLMELNGNPKYRRTAAGLGMQMRRCNRDCVELIEDLAGSIAAGADR
jgi:UDP:flavonoid glycosyltransferase YjiC (YdhE family)